MREAPQHGAADEDGLSAESDGLEHVSAAADASIQVHLAPPAHCLHHLSQNMSGDGRLRIVTGRPLTTSTRDTNKKK